MMGSPAQIAAAGRPIGGATNIRGSGLFSVGSTSIKTLEQLLAGFPLGPAGSSACFRRINQLVEQHFHLAPSVSN